MSSPDWRRAQATTARRLAGKELTAGGIDRDSAEVIANAGRELAEQGDQRHGRTRSARRPAQVAAVAPGLAGPDTLPGCGGVAGD